MNDADWRYALSQKPTMDDAWEDIMSLSLAELEAKRGDVLDFLSKSTRGAIAAPPGSELSVADYASIEARVLFWEAGEERALDVLHAGQNIYKDMSGAIMIEKGEPLADPQAMPKGTQTYQLGKQSILGLGYEMGAPKFMITCEGYGIIIDLGFARKIVKLYRTTYSKVPELWRAYEKAAILAIKRGPRAKDPIMVGRVGWAMRGKFLHAKLPSGRLLSYYDPKIVKKPVPWDPKDLRDSIVFWGVDEKKRWRLQDTYGGKLCLAEGTRVASRRGWVPIETIEVGEQVWDGVDWVRCGGAVCNGVKPTLDVRGVSMTDDHLVLTKERGWLPAKEVVGSRSWSSPANVMGAGPCLQKSSLATYPEMAGKEFVQKDEFSFSAVAESRQSARSKVSEKALHPTASNAPDEKDAPQISDERSALICSFETSSCGQSRSQFLDATTPKTPLGKTTEVEASGSIKPGEEIESSSSRISSGCLDTKIGCSPSTGSTTTPGIGREISDSPPPANRPEIAVYDLVDCGPRNRFVVLGEEPIVVHNCENIIQAISRDIMADAMLRCGAAGYTPVMTVHDEIVSEDPLSDRKASEFEKLLCQLPAWAEGLPIDAEGWKGRRYRK